MSHIQWQWSSNSVLLELDKWNLVPICSTNVHHTSIVHTHKTGHDIQHQLRIIILHRLKHTQTDINWKRIETFWDFFNSSAESIWVKQSYIPGKQGYSKMVMSGSYTGMIWNTVNKLFRRKKEAKRDERQNQEEDYEIEKDEKTKLH